MTNSHTFQTILEEVSSEEYRQVDQEPIKSSPTEASEDTSLLAKSGVPCGVSCYVPARYVLAFWSFLGLGNMFMLRMAINIAILDMATNGSSTVMTPLVNKTLGGKHVSHNEEPNTFQWSEYQQYVLLSAFYYGYFSTQILGGYASGKFGSKIILGLGLLVTSVLALATPFAAWHSYSLLLACRVGQGLAQGLAQPCMHTMWSHWAPESEKSILMTITYSGCQLGTIIATLVTGYTCESQDHSGWQTVFFIFGGAGVIWSLFWLTLIYDTPREHPRISQQERDYIETTTKQCTQQKHVQVHWLKVVKSPALHAIVAAHFANDWGCFALMTCFPKYLKSMFSYDLSENGLLSSLPFIVLLITNPLSGWVADWIRGRQLLSTKNTRKLVNSIGLFVPSALTLAVCFFDESRTVAVSLLVAAVGISGFTMAGYSVNHLDIAPAFAGTLFGITNTIGTTTGFMGPVILGALTKHKNSPQHWNTFFYITSAIFFTGGLLFLLFAQGEIQDWTSATLDCSIQDLDCTDNKPVCTDLENTTGCTKTETSVESTGLSNTP